jgi:hypothetical protein
MVENGDDLDRLLENALASYSGQEPRAGIEQRILRRVRPVYHASEWILPGVALAAVAILCVAGMITISRRENRPVATAPPPPPVAMRPAAVASPKGIQVSRKRLPTQERFPSVAPLTNEERALLLLAESAPDQARNVLEGWDPGEITPLSIDEISIPPLSNDGGE